jgi:HPt (histidine-containing phosphotransfer) domain-containing protein
MSESLPVIDLDLGAKLLGCDEPTAKKMIKELSVLLVDNLQALRSAYAAHDIKKVADIAHYVYGGSCYCGVPRLKAAAFVLEKAAIDVPSPEFPAAYQKLCQEMEAVISASCCLIQ